MEKYQTAEKFIPINSKIKICLIAPTGFGKTTLLNKLIGFDEENSPFSTSNATTTVFSQQLIISSSSSYSELFIKLKSEKEIIHFIETNIINAIKEAQNNKDPHKIYAKLTHDPGTEFPLYYSLRYENEITSMILKDILILAERASDVEKEIFEDEIVKFELFRDAATKILKHLCSKLQEVILEGKKSRDLIFELDSNSFDCEGIWVKSKDSKSLINFSKCFTTVSHGGKGEYLTPTVSLLRFKIPALEIQNSFIDQNQQVEICITDTIGIGQKGSEVSSEVMFHIKASDYFFILQTSGTGGFNESLLKFVATSANSGHLSKLRFVFTKFDIQYKDKRYDGDKDEVRWEMSSSFTLGPILSNLESLVYEDFDSSDSGEDDSEKQSFKMRISITKKTFKMLEKHLEGNCFFSGRFSIQEEYVSRMCESSLKDLINSVDLKKNNQVIPVSVVDDTGGGHEIMQDPTSSVTNYTKELKKVLYKFNLDEVVQRFIEVEMQKYKGRWQTVKALNRRYAEKTSTHWNGLDPVSSFIQQAQEKFRRDLQNSFSFDEYQEDRLCQIFFELIFDFTVQNLFHDSNVSWIESFRLSGSGSTSIRKDKIRLLFEDYLRRDFECLPKSIEQSGNKEILFDSRQFIGNNAEFRSSFMPDVKRSIKANDNHSYFDSSTIYDSFASVFDEISNRLQDRIYSHSKDGVQLVCSYLSKNPPEDYLGIFDDEKDGLQGIIIFMLLERMNELSLIKQAESEKPFNSSSFKESLKKDLSVILNKAEFKQRLSNASNEPRYVGRCELVDIFKEVLELLKLEFTKSLKKHHDAA